MKKGAVLLLALLLTLALTACGRTPPDDGSAAAPDRQEEPDAGYTAGGGEIVQIDGFREIDIQWIAGKVVVERYDGKVTELSETKLDGSPVSLKMEWRLNEDTGKLEIRSQPVQANTDEGKLLTVRLPRDTVLYELDINTVSADVDVQASFTQLTELAITTVSGSVTAADVTADEVSLASTSGELAGVYQAQRLDVDTVSGKVTLTLPNVPQELEAETTSGDVTLTLSAQPAAPVALRFQTVSGVFRSDIDSADNAANVWEFQTVSGSVTVSAAA